MLETKGGYMRKLAAASAVIAFVFASSASFAERIQFPDKGWHKGFWIAAMGGMTQVDNDTNIQTNRKFDGTFIPAFGLSLGWDIADWIGPMLQLQYGTETDQVGNGTVNYPFENAREHAISIRLAARATLPYFTRASWQPDAWKIIPYLKLGGTAHGLYVNAVTDGNKIGSWGGGVSVGAGVETLIIDRVWFGIDLSEDLMFLQSHYKTIGGVNTKIVDGGFKPMFTLMGMLGYHF
jgi:hypothetical protein